MAAIPEKIGRYDILETVGKGGMGVLYRAHDAVLQRDVALKMMLVDFSHDTAARERFQREARAVARLQHRNVVTIHELGEVEGTPYIVMEFLGGRDLDALLKQKVDLTIVQKLDIVSQVCDGLSYAHEQGIVHRDIKPGNVRVLEDGTVKILDFGIAKFAMSSVTQTGTVMGTPSYMAPEQIMGQGIDGRADLFSAGVLLYELLAGVKPFQGDSPTAVVYQIMNGQQALLREAYPEIPEAVDDIIAHALEKDPAERYATAKQMSIDIQTVRAMIDPQLHTGHTPVLGMPSTGRTTQMSVPLYATQKVRTAEAAGGPAASGDKTILATGPAHAPASELASVATLPAERDGKGKGIVIGVGAAVVAVVLGVAAYMGLLTGGGDAQPSEQTAATAGTEGAAGAAGAGAATPAATELLVVSSPQGATIAVDGVDTGKVTPAAIPRDSIAEGSTIELGLKGYRPLSYKVTAADLKAGNKDLRLVAEAQAVRLKVTGTYPFELVQGSQVISASATTHDLTVQPRGGVTARNKEMLLDSSLGVRFDRSQMELTVPGAGELAVFSAVETCIVGVDGTELGFPPIPRKAIASGSHTVTLSCPDGKGDTQKITVAPGERTQVAFGPPKGQ